jgi:Cu(I)/Ag(I) efflux system membrane fusion protein/cobalt-zinc-cadmium efflux system membrane fusion protein
MQAVSGTNMQSMSSSGVSGGGASQQSDRIEFTSDASPPQKGSNTLRVKLTDGNGAMVSGAEVEVAVYMAAMPEMGMAAMNTNTKLTEKSSGLHEKTSELPCGGTWQVTVTVKQNGQLVATKNCNSKWAAHCRR